MPPAKTRGFQENLVTTLGWLCIVFGVLVAAVIIAVCIYDPYAIATGKITVSRFTLDLGWKHPGLAALVAAMLTLPVGILIGHLWFPQYVAESEMKLHRPG
jgi:hypothetical protein